MKKLSLRFILDWYDAWLRDPEPAKVAAALEISSAVLQKRLEAHPELKEAKELAETRRGHRETFSGYVYQQLSPACRKLWDQLQFWNDSDNAYEKIEHILSGQTKQLRQELWLHALVTSNFNLSTACRMVAVSRNCLEEWRKDLAFRQLVEEIQWHKKNFFENALLDLVEQRHPAAVLFVNRTINSDRGYTEKVQVEHSGQVGMGFSLEELDLPLATRQEILAAIRRHKEREANPPIDVEAPEPRRLAVSTSGNGR